MRMLKLPMFRSFQSDERGFVTVETIFAIMFLSWWYVASFVFYDVYRQYIANVKATYTLGDLISRQAQVDEPWLEGLTDMYGYLTRWRSHSQVRYTSIMWDETDDKYIVDWSFSTGTDTPNVRPELEDADLLDYLDRLPILVDGEYVIMVESMTEFSTLFEVGIPDMDLENLVVTSPRFAVNVVKVAAGT